MSEQTTIRLHTATIHAFGRRTRHRQNTTTPAATVRNAATVEVARRTYRAMRQGGMTPHVARTWVFLLLVEKANHVTIERVTL